MFRISKQHSPFWEGIFIKICRQNNSYLHYNVDVHLFMHERITYFICLIDLFINYVDMRKIQ